MRIIILKLCNTLNSLILLGFNIKIKKIKFFCYGKFFALLCAILYFADAGFHIVKIVKEGYKSKPPAAK
jgi:hypothetical protein